ncbi:MAG: site-specific integrase [Pyrinomonadaceae bacterium]|nr:site-specific integrase [Pyrinomonadaceae bacterium]
MSDIRWTLYPRVAACPDAKAWIEIQRKLLLAPKTIDAYARALNDFLGVCDHLEIVASSATRSSIASYVDEMVHRSLPNSLHPNTEHAVCGLANRTMQLRLTAVRLFFDFLIEVGLRTDNPVGRGRYTPANGFYGTQRGLLPRYEQPPWIPSDEQWDHFLNAVLREESLRNQVMVFICYDGALRRSELLSLTLSDIDFPHQKITIRPEVAKNKSGRTVFYGDATSELLCSYIQHRQCLLNSCSGARPVELFISETHRNRGRPLTYEMWNKIVQRVARRAELPLFKTHTFRHLRLTDLARCKLDLHEIALYAGHRSFKTTHQYIHLSNTELAERVRQATKHLDQRRRLMLESSAHENAQGDCTATPG